MSRWSQRKLAANRAAKHGSALPESVELSDERLDSDGRIAAPVALSDAPAENSPNEPIVDQVGNFADKPTTAATPSAETMLTEADLPPIDGLTAQSDYTVFLKANVPAGLRKAALRKLWVSDPVLANLDRLNDYDDDYTIVTSMTMDDTIYKIGRGFLDEGLKAMQGVASEPASTGEAPTAPGRPLDSQGPALRPQVAQSSEDKANADEAGRDAGNADAGNNVASDVAAPEDSRTPDRAESGDASTSDPPASESSNNSAS